MLLRCMLLLAACLHAQAAYGSRELQPTATMLKWYLQAGGNGSFGLPLGQTCGETDLSGRPSDEPISLLNRWRPSRVLSNGPELVALGLQRMRSDGQVIERRGDVFVSVGSRSRWVCADVAQKEAATRTGAAGFSVSRNFTDPAGRPLEMHAVCIAGGRPLLPDNSSGGSGPQVFGGSVASVICSIDSGLTWLPAAPLPFEATGMVHASIPAAAANSSNVSVGGAIHVLAGGWRGDFSQDLLVPQFLQQQQQQQEDTAFGGDSGPTPPLLPPASDAARFLLPAGWTRVRTAAGLLERSRPVMAWLRNNEKLVIGGGVTRLQDGGGAGTGRGANGTHPALGSNIGAEVIDRELDSGEDPTLGLGLTDTVAVDILPALFGGGPEALANVTREPNLQLPVLRPPPGSSVFTLASQPGSQNTKGIVTDVLILLVGGDAYTTLWGRFGDEGDDVGRLFTLREHVLYGTPTSIADRLPASSESAPGSLISIPVPGASPRDPGFLLAVEPATGHVYRGSMLDCGQGILPSPCGSGTFQTICRTSPADFTCLPCVACPLGTLPLQCSRYTGRQCQPCAACPLGQVPYRACPLPSTVEGDRFTTRLKQVCAPPGRPSVLSLPQVHSLWACVGVQALCIAACVAAAAYSRWGAPGDAGERDAASTPPDWLHKQGRHSAKGHGGGNATTAVEREGQGATEGAPSSSAAEKGAPAAWGSAALSALRVLVPPFLAAMGLFGPTILLGFAAASLSKPHAELLAPRGISEAVIATVVVASCVLLPSLNAVAIAHRDRREPDLNLWWSLRLPSQPRTTVPSLVDRCSAPGLALRPAFALRKWRARHLADHHAAQIMLSVGEQARRCAVMRQLLVLDAALHDAPLAIASLVYLSFARDVTPTRALPFVDDNTALIAGSVGLAALAFVCHIAHLIDAAVMLVTTHPSRGVRLFAATASGVTGGGASTDSSFNLYVHAVDSSSDDAASGSEGRSIRTGSDSNSDAVISLSAGSHDGPLSELCRPGSLRVGSDAGGRAPGASLTAVINPLAGASAASVGPPAAIRTSNGLHTLPSGGVLSPSSRALIVTRLMSATSQNAPTSSSAVSEGASRR